MLVFIIIVYLIIRLSLRAMMFPFYSPLFFVRRPMFGPSPFMFGPRPMHGPRGPMGFHGPHGPRF